MAIGSVIRRGDTLYIHDERGHRTGTIIVVGPRDDLLGYTGSSVTVRIGSMIHTYDGRGRRISRIPI